jgi:hypothetical protein
MRIKPRVLSVLAFLLAPSAFCQMKPNPIDEEDLLKAVRANLSADELVVYIRNRGVGFLLAPKTREKFVQAKASPRVLQAIEESIREQVGTPPAPACPTPPPEPPFQVKAGAALSKREVLILLESRVDVERVTKIVELRGVSFENTGETPKEIRAAGGTAALNGVIIENYKPVTPPPPTPPPPASATTAPSQPGGQSQPAAAPEPAQTPSLYTQVSLPWNEVQARATKKAQPAYTADMRNRGLTGIVMIRMIIGVNGKVKAITPGPGPDALVRLTIDAYRQWEFQPAKVNGNPVEVSTFLQVKY